MKAAISVTLQDDNVSWLKGRARTSGLRSVSALLDRLVSEARASGRADTSRSVVGTIDIEPSNPLLGDADEAVRAMFDVSVARPSRFREQSEPYGVRQKRSSKPAKPLGMTSSTKKRPGRG